MRLWSVWLDWLDFCDCGFRLSALWCPLSAPTILVGFLLPWTWDIPSRLLQQSAATAPYLGRRVSPHCCCIWPWTWGVSGKGNGKPLQYSCLENPVNSMKRQNDRTLKDELLGLIGAQYATGDPWRNNSRKNEGTEPKQKQQPVVDVTGDRSKVQCSKETNWEWSNRRWQEHQHSRNQQTKMDWNVWI